MECNTVSLAPFLDDRMPGIILCDATFGSGRKETTTLEYALAILSSDHTIVTNAQDVIVWMYQHLYFKIA